MGTFWRAARPLVLASKSLARRSLLESAGIPLVIATAALDERMIEAPLRARAADGSEIARHLARAKAQAVSQSRLDDLVLGADQTLELDGSIFSKPVDRTAAAAQLSALSGRTHRLHSALCLMRGKACIFEHVDTAKLTCRPYDADFIETYLTSAGAAVLASVGAYQLEALGIHLFERIEGDYATILGLPLLPLLAFLRKEGSLAG
ncbi:MAG: Maf family protein [Beijerinckiaceae bacterium]